ncbi:MAG: CDP-diacylglycerol--glycerol-3-phosphate 3-phosphatidyltransferase [Lachnospiraceae bacterium]|uniref:CDP-diacylglycerol--glycerol-3-phosphate 3-phosphatidyltransferase n=1 Tax=Candidatus Weimeria bifida TaxID=2599074 RepID=A0A6N7J0K0_9FIRM|nr:CDP-diacylglycerol--glycerol-3-phosphate 3-phosphatidyltransferase [Candidatus Weimeria bifida]RRF97107.1 MAG: CDP-diacylglycerol--glycerol-3-phosphate 3-phosphatidyltransferase [Lachnospiraceae bacterium]
MNLPNKLTTLRMILVPVFAIVILVGGSDNYMTRIIAEIIFIAASLTDMADGKIARKYNLITDYGKFMDPLADKLLVCTAMICLMSFGQLPAWVLIIIIGREFIISGFRLVAADKGRVIAANYWGKFKTVFQMSMVIVMILKVRVEPFALLFKVLETLLMYIAVTLTIVSLITYIVQNRDILKEQE